MANNIGNLIPVKKGQRTKEEQKEFATKGGIESGKSRLRKKTLREIADLILSKQANPKVKKTISELYPDLDPEEITNDIAMVGRQVEKAIRKADTRAFEVLQATIGEKPVEQIEDITYKITEEDKEIAKESAKKEWNLVEK